MDLKQLRKIIDATDEKLVKAYLERIETVKSVGEYKLKHGINLEHADREKEVIEKVTSGITDADAKTSVALLYKHIIWQSKLLQSRQGRDKKTCPLDDVAITSANKTEGLSVACQGVSGAYSEIAARKIFRNPSITFSDRFKEVFEKVKSGQAEFGVLPIENSTAGSVNEVYDLLTEYGLYVCYSEKLSLHHLLLGTKDASPDDVKTVYSHPQALYQCHKYLDAKGYEQVKTLNTAMAAEFVMQRNDKSLAAIGSEGCAQLYSLKVLDDDIQQVKNNYTRFIVVSDKKQSFSAVNRLSLIVSLEHTEGSLSKLLSLLAAYGVNIEKLESRPIPERPFEFMFYFDLEVRPENDMHGLFNDIGLYLKDMIFLGAYHENNMNG